MAVKKTRRLRTYEPIWLRIKASVGGGNPVQVKFTGLVEDFLKIKKAVIKEKHADTGLVAKGYRLWVEVDFDAKLITFTLEVAANLAGIC